MDASDKQSNSGRFRPRQATDDAAEPGSESAPVVDPAIDTEIEEDEGRTELTPRQERAIAALMTEQSILRAAQVAGVGERTLHKWLDSPRFSAEYRRVRREAFRQAISLCQRLSASAVATLAKILGDSKAPYSAKVAAAQVLLKFGREGIELEDLEARLAALEQAQAAEAQAAAQDRAWRNTAPRAIAGAA
jgi:hypothetical protein